jgi:hypothetical protein
MTQRSYYQNGVVHGDASAALYSVDEIDTLNAVFRNSGDGYVSTYSYGGTAFACTGGSLQVTVAEGYAVVGGSIVHNDTPRVIAVGTGVGETYDRWDRVILRVNKETEVATIELLVGHPQAVPTLPELQTENECIVELALCKIYIRATTSTYTYTTYDERVMWEATEPCINAGRNLFWMSGANTGITTAPAYGTTVNTITVENSALEEPYPYGQFLKATLGGTGGAPARFYLTGPQIVSNSHSRWITFQFMARCETGISYFSVRGASVSPNLVIPISENLVLITYRYWYNPATETTLLPGFYSYNDSILYLSPITVTYGLTPALPIPDRELVLYWEPREIHPSGSVSTAYSFQIDLLARGLEGMLQHVQYWDSASAASAASLALSKNATGLAVARVDVEGLPNSTRRGQQVFVEPELNPESASETYPGDWREYFAVTTSGAGSAIVKEVGIK